tara:strand:+ start:26969 stop:27577 length:609 start_codon:yes stop_codon:yes gene_type:complete
MNDVVSVVTKKEDDEKKVIKVFDNFLDHNERDDLENGLFDESFPWYYNKHTVYPGNKYFKSDKKNLYDNDQLVHGFTMYEKINSSYTHLPLMLWHKFINHTQNNGYQVLRMKSNLSFSNNKMNKNSYSIPHIDLDEEHQTLIYYVNYCDGDLFLFTKDDSDNVKKRIETKRGRLIWLKEPILHAAGHPNLFDKRCSIVINFK